MSQESTPAPSPKPQGLPTQAHKISMLKLQLAENTSLIPVVKTCMQHIESRPVSTTRSPELKGFLDILQTLWSQYAVQPKDAIVPVIHRILFHQTIQKLVVEKQKDVIDYIGSIIGLNPVPPTYFIPPEHLSIPEGMNLVHIRLIGDPKNPFYFFKPKIPALPLSAATKAAMPSLSTIAPGQDISRCNLIDDAVLIPFVEAVAYIMSKNPESHGAIFNPICTASLRVFFEKLYIAKQDYAKHGNTASLDLWHSDIVNQFTRAVSTKLLTQQFARVRCTDETTPDTTEQAPPSLNITPYGLRVDELTDVIDNMMQYNNFDIKDGMLVLLFKGLSLVTMEDNKDNLLGETFWCNIGENRNTRVKYLSNGTVRVRHMADEKELAGVEIDPICIERYFSPSQEQEAQDSMPPLGETAVEEYV